MLTLENYEEYLMLAADGELDDEGRQALAAFLAQHPELAGEAAVWDALRLMPDTTIVYEEKNALLRKQKTILFFQPRMLAAAAVLALLVSVLAFWKFNGIIKSISVVTLIPVTLPAKMAVSSAPDSSAAVRVVVASAMHSGRKKAITKHPIITAEQHPATEEIAVIIPGADRKIGVAPVLIYPQLVALSTAMPDLPEGSQTQVHQGSGGFPAIHIAPANQRALAALKRGLEERLAQASATAKTVKEATLARVSSSPLHVGF